MLSIIQHVGGNDMAGRCLHKSYSDMISLDQFHDKDQNILSPVSANKKISNGSGLESASIHFWQIFNVKYLNSYMPRQPGP